MLKNCVFLCFLLLFSCAENPPAFVLLAADGITPLVGSENARLPIGIFTGEDTAAVRSWRTQGLELEFSNDDLLRTVLVSTENFRLDTGLGVGSSRADIVTTYGKPRKDGVEINKPKHAIGKIPMLIYDEATFLLDADDRVEYFTLGALEH